MTARPVFVIGSPRSGTSILTWSLGQHPNLLALEETNWIARLTVGLGLSFNAGASRGDRTHLSSSGITEEDFFARFGEAADDVIMSHKPAYGSEKRSDPFRRIRSSDDPKQRWVDGTPLNSYCVYGIHLMFPEARFIHLLRDVRQVVPSLMRFSRAGRSARDHTAGSAYSHWLETVRCCVAAEKALGSDVVMRAGHAELAESPEALIERCLEFVGEDFSPDCLLPLDKRINSSRVEGTLDTGSAEAGLAEEANALSEALLAEGRPTYAPDEAALAELKRSFMARINHLRAALGGGPGSEAARERRGRETPGEEAGSRLAPRAGSEARV